MFVIVYNSSMDLVSNYVGEISASQFGGKKDGVTSAVDLNDKTFEEILEKQLNDTDYNNLNQVGNNDFTINIGDFDGHIPEFNISNSTNPINNTNESFFNNFSNSNEFTTSDVLTFFPSLFDTKPTMTQDTENGLYNFERKFAANSYGKYAKNIVTNLGEFVSDALR